MASLAGRAAIITGASQGLGLAIARAFVQAGADVILCARDAETLVTARDDVAMLAVGAQRVIAVQADISQTMDVNRVVATAQEAFEHVHILVNNAGIYGPKGLLEQTNWDDWVRAIEVNLLGSVLMCRAVLPHFKAQRYGKIVQLSGGGATNPLPRLSAYAASKAAVVRLAETLAAEVQPWHIDVNAIAPGALNTRMLTEVLEAGPDQVGLEFYERALKQKTHGGAGLESGARLAVFLASAASDGLTGKLLSAVWDPWENIPDHRADLQASDVYTLRRIVPKDRGFGWGERS